MVEEFYNHQVSDAPSDDEELTSEDLLKIAKTMEDNVPVQDEKHNLHSFLHSVVVTDDTTKVANLRDDDILNELGLPVHNVRGSLFMKRISEDIMDNTFFSDWFQKEAEETLATSLSRNGFLVKQATMKTTQVADATKKTKVNKGWFKSKKETSGGDITST